MALTATAIHVGAARIFIGTTNPATGTPPTIMTHTSGVPGTGSEIGYTEGDAVFEYIATKEEIFGEQDLAPVDVFTKQEMCKLSFSCKETVLTALKAAFDSIGFDHTSGRELFYAGGGTGILAPFTQALTFTAMQRNAPTKFFVGVIYKVYSAKGVAFPFSKTKASSYPVELVGMTDVARNGGDRLFQFFKEL
jgi:hypothetical protein